MSVVQGINTRLQMHTPLQIVRCCNLPLMPAVRVVRTQTGCVRFASPAHVPCSSVETMAQELEPLHSFMPGGRTTGTHIVIRTHSVTSSQLPSLSLLLSSRSCYALTFSLPSWHRLRLPLKEVIPRRTPLQVTRILLLRRF